MTIPERLRAIADDMLMGAPPEVLRLAAHDLYDVATALEKGNDHAHDLLGADSRPDPHRRV